MIKVIGIISWIIFGGIAGWLASLIMGTDARQGIVMNVILGVIGALVGGVTMSLLGQTGFTGFNLYSFLVAVLGAVIVIGLAQFMTGSSPRQTTGV